MKQVLPLMLALLMVGCATTRNSANSTSASHGKGRRMTVRTTAYTHTEPGGSNNAIGTRLRFNGQEQSAAADWSWMPLGTKFRVLETGKTYVIEDYGSALVGRETVDIYLPNMAAVRKWGVRQLDIEILEWGSKAMSLKMLTPRTHKRYIQTMVAALRRSLPAAPSS